MKTINTTLLLVIKDGKILLAQKKRGFGEGKFNGVGGKAEEGETIEQTMLRETKEEIGIVPTIYKKQGEIVFDEYMKGERSLVVMSIFVAKDFEGEPIESDEMIPEWFDLDKVPFDKMFPDDKFWFPHILDEKFVRGKFVFDENFKLISYSVDTSKFNKA